MPEKQTSSDDPTPTDARPAQVPAERLARVRRRPNIPAFLGTGALLGLVIGVLYSKATDNGDYSEGTATAYVAVFFGILGLLLGALAVIFLDKRADRS